MEDCTAGATGATAQPGHASASGARALTLRLPLAPDAGPPRPTSQEEREVRVDNVIELDLHDYDHDGRATEFVLPVGGVGCAYHGYVVVGISRARPKLHVFGTAVHPHNPLELARAGWDVLRNGSAGTYVAVECGFRGSDDQVEVALRAVAGRIHASSTRYTCPRSNGRVIERQVW